MKRLLLLLLLLPGLASALRIDVQGHRGARAAMPENSLAAFDYALKVGVDTLELDTVVTRDGKVVVLHDPAINPKLCLDADGKKLAEPVLVSRLTLAEVKRFDCGTLVNPRFSRSKRIKDTRIPTLDEVFELVKASKHPAAKTVQFNIETKIDPSRPEATAGPEDFVEAIRAAVATAGVGERVTVQSFDWRTLRPLAGELATACLSEDEGLDEAATQALIASAKEAGCGTWSPQHTQLSPEHIERAIGANAEVQRARVDCEHLETIMGGFRDEVIAETVAFLHRDGARPARERDADQGQSGIGV